MSGPFVSRFTAKFNEGDVAVSGFGETLLDDASAAAARTTLGVVTGTEATAGLTKLRSSTKTLVTNTIVSNAAAATQEILNDTLRRIQVDLTNYTQARLCASVLVAGSAGTNLGVQYSVDAGSTWLFLDGSADGALGAETPQVSIATTGPKVSAYMTLAAGAQANVLIRLITQGGDASADPSLGVVNLEVK